MYNLKKQKIWKIGSLLFLSFLLLGNQNIIGHAEEIPTPTETMETELPETPIPTEGIDVTTTSDTTTKNAVTNIPQSEKMSSINSAETLFTENIPMSWVYFDGNLQIYTNDEYQKYSGSKVKMKVLGSMLSSSFSGVIYNNYVMVPLEKVFQTSKIKAEYTYDSDTHIIKIKKRNRNIILHLGSTQALVNGTLKEMNCMPQLVTDAEGNVEHIMVPAKFIATSLGYKYTWSSSSKTMQVTRKNITYFSWTNTELPRTDTIDYDYPDSISSIVAKYQNGLDVIKIACANSDNVKIKKSSTAISITYNDAVFSDNTYAMDLSDAYIARSFSIKQNNNDTVKIILKKTSSKKYYIQKTGGYINIILGKSPVRIAIDCGHGANTPGKRTPALPIAIDYNQDGIVDFKKGRCIKEHIPNVGVGKYLAAELERCGFDVYRSAFGADDISLTKRQKNMNHFDSDYSVSVHFNAAGTGKSFNAAQGVEVFYHSFASKAGKSKSFAQTILKEMIKGTPQVNRGVKSMPLALCNTKETGTKASILVECAFMTNYREATTMVGNSKFWKETAQEIAKGICSYTGVTYVKE